MQQKGHVQLRKVFTKIIRYIYIYIENTFNFFITLLLNVSHIS